MVRIPAQHLRVGYPTPASLDIVHMHTHVPTMKRTPRLHACYCFAARQAARGISKLYEQHLAVTGVTVTQFSILALLDEMPGMTMNELAQAMVMDRTTLIRNIKPLQRDGLLVCAPSGSNVRKQVLSLSLGGARKLREASPFWKLAQQEFESQVGVTRATKLRRDLLDLTQ
jgi:DNA-binding MarR family transcriptional regulator